MAGDLTNWVASLMTQMGQPDTLTGAAGQHLARHGPGSTPLPLAGMTGPPTWLSAKQTDLLNQMTPGLLSAGRDALSPSGPSPQQQMLASMLAGAGQRPGASPLTIPSPSERAQVLQTRYGGAPPSAGQALDLQRLLALLKMRGGGV